MKSSSPVGDPTREPVLAAAERLSFYVCTHGADALAAQTAAYARLLLLDFMAVGLRGAQAAHVRRAAEALRALSGEQGAAVLTGGKLSIPHAAFVNALSVHSTDWDDSHLSAIVHPGAPVWAAILALAGRAEQGTAGLLAAAVVGYETSIRLGRAIQPQHMFNGFHGTATCGVFGAAAAAARLLGLDQIRTRHALGLAASSASGSTQCILSGSHAKSFQAAKAAHDGVVAALMAEAGLEAPAESIDGPRGFLRAYAAGATPHLSLDDLGRQDSILGVMIKRYPIVAHLHGAIDAAIAPTGKGEVDVGAISAVEVTVDPAIVRNNNNPAPRDVQAACMSLPFCVATALWLKFSSSAPIGLDHETLERCLGEQEVRGLAAKVKCLPWPESAMRPTGSSMWSRIVVHAGGREWVSEAEPCWGGDAPDARGIIIGKARRVTAGLLTPEAQEHWIAAALEGPRISLGRFMTIAEA